MQITVRQLQAALHDMGLYNMALAALEQDEESFAVWKRPATVISRTDNIVERWRQRIGISPKTIDLFFDKASKKPGGPSGPQIISGGTMSASEEPSWLRLARTYVGLKEVPGEASNPAIDAFFTDAGFKGFRDDTAWCAAFVGAVVARSGFPKLGSLTARDAEKYGTRLSGPKIGAIAVLWRESRSSWKGHVGFVVGFNETNKTIELLGGNQGDSVSIAQFSTSQVLSYRWPVAPTIKALKQAGSQEAALSETARKASIITVLAGAANTIATNYPDLVTFLVPNVEAVKAVLSKVDELASLVGQYDNGWLILAGCVFYIISKQWQWNRVERALKGFPILGEYLSKEASP